MALEVADGTISITTGAAGTTFTVSGLSFQPKAIFFFWSGRQTAGQGPETSRFGCGIAVSTTSRRGYVTQSTAAALNAATDSVWSNDCCVLIMNTSGAISAKADLNAINSDGFELIVDDNFPITQVVGWIAWGGADLTSAEIVDFAEPASTGDQDIATSVALNTGLDDKAVIFLGSASGAANTPAVDSTWMLGVAAGNTISNYVLSGASDDAQATMITYSYCIDGECVATCGAADVVTSRASVTAWQSTGFRLNWAEVDGTFAFNHSALVMKGGRWQAGDAVTRTDTTEQAETTSYVPKCLLVASHNKTKSTSDTVQAGDERSVGVATSPTSRRYASLHDVDAGLVAVVGIGYNETQMYANQSSDAIPVVEGLMDLVSFDATPGFTYVMDDADPAAAFFWYLLAADAPTGHAHSKVNQATLHSKLQGLVN